ncbi:MAG: ElyC/SanA/YdcF family protein [Candidatus Omnitrophica bacterium]|nr:ElyC/SanA/YdcF family protein [Candidatus Omnitrophota bacterium]
MLKNKNIICISSIDWDFVWQGHQEIMSRLARNGNRILFVENTGVRSPGIRDFSRIRSRIKSWFKGISGIRQEKENLFICSPILLPFPYLRLARWINSKLFLSKLRRWIKLMNFEKPIIWVFLPTPLTLDIIENINSELVVYYCIDNFRVSSPAASKIKNSEIKLIKKADLVFVTSRELFNYCSQFNPKVYFFPFGVNYEYFESVRDKRNINFEALKNIPRPVIGYIGGIHKWIDFKLIREVAERMPGCSFVLVGPIQADISNLNGIKNIYLLGKKEHSEIPFFIKEFDVCIIPYLITDYTKNVYPTKLNEYLAFGKPVISTVLPEVLAYNEENGSVVDVAVSAEEFIKSIQDYMKPQEEKAKAASIRKRIDCSQRNGWAQRIENMSVLINDLVIKKELLHPVWSEELLLTLKRTRKRLFKFFLAGVFLFYLLFYTPLVWFLAEPLKISQSPEKSDCIVVFAGGVGESGRALQGYEERVEHAVKLYKSGFAPYIIFSSGYQFYFKEPDIMKALAVSLGVPAENIIIEEKANNTYKNVLYCKKILNQKGWHKILLVSAPYHMKRVSLVVNKIAPDLKVIFVPMPNSGFYRHNDFSIMHPNERQLSVIQFKSFIHEYVAIIVYKLRGLI